MDYIERMRQEKELLNIKIKGAEDGLNKLQLDETEKNNLREQLGFMIGYRDSLKKRIDYAESK